MKNYTINIHQNKNNYVLITEDIDEFTNWVMKKVNEEQKQSIKTFSLFQYEILRKYN